MIIYVTETLEVFMQALLLIGVIPFLFLFAVLILAALIIVTSVLVEFPVVLLGAAILGWAGYYVFNQGKEVLCEQM
jgi:4-hydroxybenzoate polyprenyltransferase